MKNKLFAIQSFDSYYYTSRRPNYKFDLREAFNEAFRKSKQRGFYEKFSDLRNMMIVEYKNALALFSLRFDSDKDDNKILTIMHDPSKLGRDFLLQFNITTQTYILDNTDGDTDYVKYFIAEFNWEVRQVNRTVSTKLDDKIDELTQVILNKNCGVNKIRYSDKVAKKRVIELLELYSEAMDILTDLNYFHEDNFEGWDGKSYNLNIGKRAKSNVASYFELSNTVQLNAYRFNYIKPSAVELAITMVHELSHATYSRFLNSLRIYDNKNKTKTFIDYLNSEQNLFNTITSLETDGNVRGIYLRYYSRKRREYLLNMDEIFARSIETKYLERLPQDMYELAHKKRENLWWMQPKELEIIQNFRKENNNFMVKVAVLENN